jgi:hypothetical protein
MMAIIIAIIMKMPGTIALSATSIAADPSLPLIQVWQFLKLRADAAPRAVTGNTLELLHPE